MPGVVDSILQQAKGDNATRASNASTWLRRAKAILAGTFRQQRNMIRDPARRKAGRMPRRAGKSYGGASYAVYVGESEPNARILIISLTLKSTRENYWDGAPGGIQTMDRLYGLNLTYNLTDSVWKHENGSRGRLAGAETRADLERLRGAAAEADLVIIDECKSFAPALLDELIRDVIEPGLMTRGGTLLLIGTPGNVPQGTFYEATSDVSRSEETGRYTAIPFDLKDDPKYAEGYEEDTYWSLHSWSLQHNRNDKNPLDKRNRQWVEALKTKKRYGWDDDHPTWRREYLGEWVMDATGLVYAYAGVKAQNPDKVTWYPEKRTATNVTGLPPEEGPWRLVMGLDFGYEDDFAVVVAAYSERLAELRHVYDFKSPHLNIKQMADHVHSVIKTYGTMDHIVGDGGGLGLLVIESLNSMYQIPVEKADKSEKYDHIEMVNSDFHTGRLKIIPGTSLEDELIVLQWDLSKGGSLRTPKTEGRTPEELRKVALVRHGKLREDPAFANHLCDALLYLWRHAYHHFSRPAYTPPARGSSEWYKLLADQEVALALSTRESMKKKKSHSRDPRAAGSRPPTRDDILWTLPFNHSQN